MLSVQWHMHHVCIAYCRFVYCDAVSTCTDAQLTVAIFVFASDLYYHNTYAACKVGK